MAAPPEIARENGKKGGRPKGSVSPKTKARQKAEALFIEEAAKHIPSMVDALIDTATGIYTAIEKDGQIIRVYKRKPEAQAIKEFFDRVMGKATQPIEWENPLELDITTELSKRTAQLAKPFLENDNEYTGKAIPKLDAGTGKNTKGRKAAVHNKNTGAKK